MVALGRNTEVLNLKERTQKYKPTAAIKCKDVCRFVHVHGQNYWLLYEPQKVFCVVPKIKLIKAFSRSKKNNFCRQKAQNTSERLSLLRIYDSLFFPTTDSIWATVIVWRLTGKIIRTVVCCVFVWHTKTSRFRSVGLYFCVRSFRFSISVFRPNATITDTVSFTTVCLSSGVVN